MFKSSHRAGRHNSRCVAGCGARAIPAAARHGAGAGSLAGAAEVAAGRQRRRPAAQAAPKRAARSRKPSHRAEEPLQTPAPSRGEKAPAPAPAYAVTCSGVFAQDSTHLKLAVKYDSRNITFGEVDGPEGSKIPGSILFPNDPKHRLEVLWTNEAGRSGTSVIAINGKSQWSAPKGMKLGLPLAALEKANGKPFKLSGFAADGTAGVAGWEGGALGSLPGGCKVGMRLAADSKAPAEARTAVAGDKEVLSSDPACARSNRRSWKS